MNPEKSSPEGQLMAAETKEVRKPLSLPEILRETANQPDLTDAEREALKTLIPKILRTARGLVNPKTSVTEAKTETPPPLPSASTSEATPDIPKPEEKEALTDPEKAGQFEKESGENGEKIREVVTALLEREDLPEGLRNFDVKGSPELAKLKMDVRKNLSDFLRWTRPKWSAVEKTDVDTNCFNRISPLYGVVKANIEGDLGREIEEKLKPLFEKQVELFNVATKENKEYTVEWYHPRFNRMIDENRDYARDSAEYHEGVSLAHVWAITEPGKILRNLKGDEIHTSFAHVFAGTGYVDEFGRRR